MQMFALGFFVALIFVFIVAEIMIYHKKKQKQNKDKKDNLKDLKKETKENEKNKDK